MPADNTTPPKQIYFAILLKTWMDLRHCNTQKISELSGLPARLIEVYAHSEADPPFTHIQALAKALNVTLPEFFAVGDVPAEWKKK